MKQYLNFVQSRSNYSFKYSFDIVFKKVEFAFFCLLSVVFLILSRFNDDFSKSVSSSFVGVSLPIAKTAAFPFNATVNLLTNFSGLIEAKKENEILKEENERLRSMYVTAINVSRENQELKRTLQFITTKSSNYKVARIVGRTHKTFSQKLYIDAGQNRDLKVGSLVSGNNGAIGRVSEIWEDKARLILATDATSRIPVITSKSRVRGILAGQNGDLMQILYLQKNHGIQVGDWVFTSGDGDTLPSGILIGVVKKVDKGYAAVEMSENIANTDIVTIIDY